MSNPSYAITFRVNVPSNSKSTALLVEVISAAGGAVTALDVVQSGENHMIVDITANAIDDDHVDTIKVALESEQKVSVVRVSDATFLVHLGGKLEIHSKAPLRNRDDLSRAYTPGVARICQAIARNRDDSRRLTIARNTVAVVTDGSAVLGLGDIGPEASMPVMEGKAGLFKEFGGVDAWPVPLATQNPDEIVRIVEAIAPAYGGINLEDIAAPRCFEIERQLRARLNIPVFHDDQHGTAIVVLAALLNALRVVEKSLEEVKVVVSGVGAAGMAIIRLLIQEGVRNIIAYGRKGAITTDSTYADADRQWLSENTNPESFSGSLEGALHGADVFIGVSSGNILEARAIRNMAPDAIVFALANPTPEVDPNIAAQHAKIVA